MYTQERLIFCLQYGTCTACHELLAYAAIIVDPFCFSFKHHASGPLPPNAPASFKCPDLPYTSRSMSTAVLAGYCLALACLMHRHISHTGVHSHPNSGPRAMQDNSLLSVFSNRPGGSMMCQTSCCLSWPLLPSVFLLASLSTMSAAHGSYMYISCHIISYHLILYYIILYYIVLCYIILYYIILYYIILYYIILYFIIFYYIISEASAGSEAAAGRQ